MALIRLIAGGRPYNISQNQSKSVVKISRNQNQPKSTEIYQNQLSKSAKMIQNQPKSIRAFRDFRIFSFFFCQNQSKSTEISRNQSKSAEISRNQSKSIKSTGICNPANLQSSESAIWRICNLADPGNLQSSESANLQSSIRFKIRFIIRKQKLKLTRNNTYSQSAYKLNRTWICAGPH